MKRPVADTVWPKVTTGGDLEPAECEWLHTNGAGAYAMSTVALMHTRRFHGLLVAALEPPLRRHVIVSHAEATVEFGKRSYSLSTHRFPDIAPTPGFRLLQSFEQAPLPTWTYRLGRGELVRRMGLVRGKNAVVLEYVWKGKSSGRLTLRPLLPMRPIHDLRSEHGGLLQRVALRQGSVSIQPVRKLPEVVFGHRHVFVGSPDWWRRFEYSEDQRREAHYQEDLWTPGTFEMPLEPDVPVHLVIALGELPDASPVELLAETEAALLAQDPGTKHSVAVRKLWVAAEQYRVPHCERPSVLAGYPWLDIRCRDALVALPGLYLCQGLVEDAKAMLRGLLKDRVDGLLPGGFAEAGMETAELPVSVDASLWLFEAARQLLIQVGLEDDFVQQELYPALKEVFERVSRTQGELVWLNSEGLVVCFSSDEPLTWMDSRAGGAIVTQRGGIAVELQALWSRGCETLAELARVMQDEALADRARQACKRTRSTFARHFWSEEVDFVYDCMDEDFSNGDAAIRPNAVLALSLDPSLFERGQAETIVRRTRELLLTPRGLRTLAPNHESYIGYYEGSMDARRAAYHQGVVWIYLLGAFARASLQLSPDDFELQLDLKEAVSKAMQDNPVLGQVAQVAAGDAPHNVGGCPAQAWSVAELLRTLQWDLSL